MNRNNPRDRIILDCMKMAQEISQWEGRYRRWLRSKMEVKK
jgi:hypothetical protein